MKSHSSGSSSSASSSSGSSSSGSSSSRSSFSAPTRSSTFRQVEPKTMLNKSYMPKPKCKPQPIPPQPIPPPPIPPPPVKPLYKGLLTYPGQFIWDKKDFMKLEWIMGMLYDIICWTIVDYSSDNSNLFVDVNKDLKIVLASFYKIIKNNTYYFHPTYEDNFVMSMSRHCRETDILWYYHKLNDHTITNLMVTNFLYFKVGDFGIHNDKLNTASLFSSNDYATTYIPNWKKDDGKITNKINSIKKQIELLQEEQKRINHKPFIWNKKYLERLIIIYKTTTYFYNKYIKPIKKLDESKPKTKKPIEFRPKSKIKKEKKNQIPCEKNQLPDEKNQLPDDIYHNMCDFINILSIFYSKYPCCKNEDDELIEFKDEPFVKKNYENSFLKNYIFHKNYLKTWRDFVKIRRIAFYWWESSAQIHYTKNGQARIKDLEEYKKDFAIFDNLN